MSTINTNSSDDEEDYVILGSSPPPSMVMEKSTVGTSMSLFASQEKTSPQISLQNGGDSEDLHPTTSQCPSLTVSQFGIDDILKFPCSEHQKIREQLEKIKMNNERQATVNQEWQDSVSQNIREANEVVEGLKLGLISYKTENERLVKELDELKVSTKEEILEKDAKIELLQLENADLLVWQKIKVDDFEPKIEHEATLREMQDQLSDLTKDLEAQNLELDDMKAKLTAAEELKRERDEETSNQLQANQYQHTLLKDQLREKDTIIQNIYAENKRLQLEKANLVVLHKNKVDPVDYVPKSEHEAKNFELEDIKTKLTAAEELHRDMRDTITMLRLRDEDTRKRAEEMTNQLQVKQDENALLKDQVEVFQKDFLQERKTREKLFTEKESISSELQLLKLKNKELMDERLNNDNPVFNGGIPESPKTRNICPNCSHELRTERLLKQHIDLCIKN